MLAIKITCQLSRAIMVAWWYILPFAAEITGAQIYDVHHAELKPDGWRDAASLPSMLWDQRSLIPVVVFPQSITRLPWSNSGRRMKGKGKGKEKEMVTRSDPVPKWNVYVSNTELRFCLPPYSYCLPKPGNPKGSNHARSRAGSCDLWAPRM